MKDMNKRYLLFAGHIHYSNRAFWDLFNTYDSVVEAVNCEDLKATDYDWAQIVDRDTLKIVCETTNYVLENLKFEYV